MTTTTDAGGPTLLPHAHAAPGESLLSVKGLEVHFPGPRIGGRLGGLIGGRHATIRAVDGVDLEVRAGETLGLVGESGCGKSTTGRAILQLLRPTAGSVRFRGQELTTLGGEALRQMRRHMQLVFQDPYASLNPRLTVGDIIGEPLQAHGLVRGDALKARVRELMETCGLQARFIRRYPHEFSGGQRQRIGIARALALDPELVVCDEPISALDVSIQAQILNLLERLQRDKHLTYLFIAHDLAAVRHVSDRIAVMYLGRVVEVGPATEVVRAPRHPYTAALVSAIPVPDPALQRQRHAQVLQGEVPSPLNPPAGCAFNTRCPLATARCREEAPTLTARAGAAPGHTAACHVTDFVGGLDGPGGHS